MTIDFTSIPGGTPLPGLFESILYLEAVTGHPWGGAEFSSAGLAVVPFEPPIHDPTYRSLLIGVFLRPVADVSITAKCHRNAGCSFQGIDASGVGFDLPGPGIPGSSDGNPPATDWLTLQFPIPDGGCLTCFQIRNSDPSPLNAAFWLKSISFSSLPLPPSRLHIVGEASSQKS